MNSHVLLNVDQLQNCTKIPSRVIRLESRDSHSLNLLKFTRNLLSIIELDCGHPCLTFFHLLSLAAISRELV